MNYTIDKRFFRRDKFLTCFFIKSVVLNETVNSTLERVIMFLILKDKGVNMALRENDIIGSIEFLKVLGLNGSTYELEGPNGEKVKLNQSEVNEDDDLEVGEEYSFFVYPNRSGELFATQNMPDITTSKYDYVKVLKTDRDGAKVDAGLPRSIDSLGRSSEDKITLAAKW